MARLGDLPKLFKSVGAFEFGRRVWGQIAEDNLFSWAAALAYSWLFAVFPFLLFLLSLIPYLPQKTRVQTEHSIQMYLESWLPTEAGRTLRENIEGNVTNLLHTQKGVVLYIGLVISIWAAAGGMAATMSALDKCYELDRGRSFVRQRLLAVAMTVVVIILLLAVLCLIPLGTALRDWIVAKGALERGNPLLVVFDVARWIMAVVFLFLVLAMVYYKGPSVRHRFNWITPGAVFCVVVWVVLGFVLRLYMDKMGARSYDRTYGALGGVAVMLLVFYIDGLVLLIGAEINSEIDFEVLKIRRGSRDFRKAEDIDAATPTSI